MQERKVPGVEMWDLLDGDETLIGRIERKRIGRGERGIFWCAYGVHPADGRMVRLELSADRDERIRTILDFRAHPEGYRQHWAWRRV